MYADGGGGRTIKREAKSETETETSRFRDGSPMIVWISKNNGYDSDKIRERIYGQA